MLKKKGFAMFDDWTEFGTSLVLFAVIILILMAFNYVSQSNVDTIIDAVLPNNDEVNAIDAEFLDTDLINLMKLQIDNDYTLGEILSYTGRNYPSPQDAFLFNGFLESEFSDRLSCDDILIAYFENYLDPISSDWYLSVYNEEDKMIFFCTPIIIDIDNPYSAELYIPEVDGNKKLKVVLEVYE